MREAKYLKKSAHNFWKSTEIQPKLLFFFICLSLKPHKIPMKKDNSKFQKQASLLVFWLQFVFSNNHSKSTGSPLREAEVKAVKVVNFVAMWLNLYPHTVLRQKDSNGDDCEKYLQKSIELCARVATHSPKDAEFYQIYAGLVSFDGQINTGRQVEGHFDT